MGMGRFEGFFTVAVPEAEGPRARASQGMRKADKIGACFSVPT